MKRFEDDVRRAAGISTEYADCGPSAIESNISQILRNAKGKDKILITDFVDISLAFIDCVYRRAVEILSGSELYLVQSYITSSDTRLVEAVYTAESRFTLPSVSHCESSKIILSPLCFSLHTDGTISTESPTIISKQPTVQLKFDLIRRPLAEFTLSIISDIFVNYIRLAKENLQNSRRLN